MFLWCICTFVSGCSVKPCPVNTTGGTSLILKCEAGQYKRTRMSVFCWPILQLCRHHADWKIKDFMQRRRDVWLVRLDIPCPGPKSRLWDSWSGVQSTRFKACVMHRCEFTGCASQIAINKSWTIWKQHDDSSQSARMLSAKHVSRPSAHILCSQ